MSAYQNSCTACGLTVHDLPLEALGVDAEELLEQFFEHDDGGALYCQGCVQRGEGVFL